MEFPNVAGDPMLRGKNVSNFKGIKIISSTFSIQNSNHLVTCSGFFFNYVVMTSDEMKIISESEMAIQKLKLNDCLLRNLLIRHSELLSMLVKNEDCIHHTSLY